MGALAYAVTNALSSLAASAFTWSSGATADRANLNDRRLAERFGAGSVASGVNVVIDMGSATALTGFAALNCNMPRLNAAHSPSLQINAADNAGMSTNLVTAKSNTVLYTASKPRDKDHVLQFPAVTKRYWQLIWSWTGGGSVPFFIGEIFAYAASTQLSRRSVYGSGETKDRIAPTLQMDYGDASSLFIAGPIRQFDFDWSDLTQTQLNELDNMYDACNGGAIPMLWINSYESVSTAAASTEQDCVYGKIVQPAFSFKQDDFAIFQPNSFSFRSLGREAGA